jgi:NADPH:quinone reductase-like Zn-dependent oxidoreductase
VLRPVQAIKAIAYDRFGSPDVLHATDIPKPAPRNDEILIKVHATTVTSGDWRARTKNVPSGFGPIALLVFGFSKPRQPVLGNQLSGHVEAVGSAVTTFKVGDRVFAYTGAKWGCYVEYKCLPQDGAVTLTPANVSDEQAAAMSFGGVTALVFLRKGHIKAGEHVLVSGASGAVGSAAVQIAKHFGARVTGVCSTGNVELVKSIGADDVIDYTKQDFTTNGEMYDVIVDTAFAAPFSCAKGSLKAGGRLLAVAGTLGDMLGAPWVSLTTTKRVIAGPVSGNADDLRLLARLAKSGTFTPVIDRCFPFGQIADAHRHFDTRHKQGSIVITWAPESWPA